MQIAMFAEKILSHQKIISLLGNIQEKCLNQPVQNGQISKLIINY